MQTITHREDGNRKGNEIWSKILNRTIHLCSESKTSANPTGSQVLFDERLASDDARRAAGPRRPQWSRQVQPLFRIILGEEHADEGTVTFPRGYKIGHLEQHLHFTKPTVLEEGCLGLSEDEEHDHYKVERILFGLGFTEEDMGRPPSSFSGGFQIRLNPGQGARLQSQPPPSRRTDQLSRYRLGPLDHELPSQTGRMNSS